MRQPWLTGTYNLMQETPYTFTSISQFNCEPNRGLTSNPMLLVNHWLRSCGPTRSGRGEHRQFDRQLTARMQQCIAARGDPAQHSRGRLRRGRRPDTVVNQFNGAIAQLTGVTQFWNDAISGDRVDKNLSDSNDNKPQRRSGCR